jgi:uncharacterized Zn-binding protein involved in type VI secretion
MVGRPAARLTDMHVCPMTAGATLPIIQVCMPTVLIGGLPAARMTDLCACVGPPPAPVDAILIGSPTVLIGGLPAARMGDPTVKGGAITTGFPTVLIGEAGVVPPVVIGGGGVVPAAMPAGPAPASRVKGMDAAAADAAITKALADAIAALDKRIGDLDAWDDATAASFRKWFGADDAASRAAIRERMQKTRDLLAGYTLDNFGPDDDAYAYVYPDDDQKIYLGEAFEGAPETGRDSRAGTLVHEASHFDTIAGTDDHAYGEQDSAHLAQGGNLGMDNADSFEFFVEDGM